MKIKFSLKSAAAMLAALSLVTPAFAPSGKGRAASESSIRDHDGDSRLQPDCREPECSVHQRVQGAR